MPKFGLKCFLGSFIFSLAAVFAATKVYLALSQEHEREDLILSDIEAKNIELFADNEENEPIYQTVNQTLEPVLALEDKSLEKSAQIDAPAADTQSQTDAQIQLAATEDSILYMPDDEEDTAETLSVLAEAEEKFIPTEDRNIVENSETAPEPLVLTDTPSEEDFQIADAAEAPVFRIPLVHNYKKENTVVSISSRSEGNQIAMASQNVALNNLGAENKSFTADEPIDENNRATAEQDSPWAVAKTANRHITKNKIDTFNTTHREEVAALDKSKQEAAKSDNETLVAYKMVKNQVIPIPEDIMNDENLTPKLAYSEENKKLEQSLLENQSHSVVPSQPEETQKPVEEEMTKMPEDVSEKSSKSLTDSIAAWFSSSDKKTEKDNISLQAEEQSSSGKETKTSSSFRRLLGLDSNKKGNIAPTELKLFFQPNRAEISGQTLEWLRAFSENVVNNENVIIEIRIDGATSYELQQKRLNLLYTILANNGVNYNKINIIFTDREPNSFIIRNVRYATEEELAKATRKADNPWY